MIGKLFDIPKSLRAAVVFDQSVFVKEASGRCSKKA